MRAMLLNINASRGKTGQMIISLHLPKTAGTSFAAVLENHFKSKFLRDYGDLPVNTDRLKRNKGALQSALNIEEEIPANIECIHGHFLPIKYLLLADKQDIKFITWMRHPVERIISHYFYWKRSYNSRSSAPLHRKFIEENWSMERFCLGPELRDMYWQFLWGFSIDYFEFIGITEHYNEDFEYFIRKFLHASIIPQKLNVRNRNRQDDEIDEAFIEQVASVHARDMELYDNALAKRQKRISENKYI